MTIALDRGPHRGPRRPPGRALPAARPGVGPTLTRRRVVSLALQGGGSHGAFTWGVLDRLLREERLRIEGLSGASAGAVNAVVLAHGLVEGGREGARRALDRFWHAVAEEIPFNLPDGGLLHALGHNGTGALSPVLRAYLGMSRVFSPSQLNPLDLNPLRDILTAQVDFERLRAEAPVKLFVGATQARTGKLRIFGNEALHIDAVLASACLPSLHHAIEIDGEAYWDGALSGNPPVFPLIFQCATSDLVVVMLHPLARPEVPTTAEAIGSRVSELGFSATFLREMRAIAHVQERVARDRFPLGRMERRVKGLRVHLIEAEDLMSTLSHESRLNTHLAFLGMLREQGEARAEQWLSGLDSGGPARDGVDLVKLFC